MGIIKSLENRRTYYNIDKNLPVLEKEIEEKIKEVTELVPDAFNMKSARIVLAFGEKHDRLWDEIYNVFEGKVPREKIDSFKAGAGTVLFYMTRQLLRKCRNSSVHMRIIFLFGQIRQTGCCSLLFGLC